MTRGEALKDFFRKTILPAALAALLYCIFRSACVKNGELDYLWLWILCGLPFGIWRLRLWIIPGGGSLGGGIALFLLNFVFAGLIGGCVLVWRLLKGRDEQCLGRCGESGVALSPPTVSAAQKLDPLQASFWTRMLYSCLVDADFLDTERFMNGDPGRGGYDDIPTLLARLQAYIEPWQQPKTELNRLRCEILNACLSAGSKPKGIYTLTVPTGGGKTVASLAFALRHAAEHRMQRVIYAIQYGVMQACGGTEAIPAALQLSLLVNTQHIRRVIPQEVGSNANSALYRRRQDYRLWTQDCLFTHRYFFHSGDRLRHLTAFIQTQGKADLCRAPAGSGDLAALEKILVIPRQRLQDHLLTSSLSHGGTTITPSVRLARKNRGVMVCGSL